MRTRLPIFSLGLALAACAPGLVYEQSAMRTPEYAFDPASTVGLDIEMRSCERYLSGPRELNTDRNEHLRYPLPVLPIQGGALLGGASNVVHSGGDSYSGRPYTVSSCSPTTIATVRDQLRARMTELLEANGYRVARDAQQRMSLSVELIEWSESRWSERITDTESSQRCAERCGSRSCDRYSYMATLGMTVTGVAPPHAIVGGTQTWSFRDSVVAERGGIAQIHCSDRDAVAYSIPADHNLVDAATELASRVPASWGGGFVASSESIRWRFPAAALLPEAAEAVDSRRWDVASTSLVAAADDGGIEEGPEPAELLHEAAIASMLGGDYDTARNLLARTRELEPDRAGLDWLDEEITSQQNAASFFGRMAAE